MYWSMMFDARHTASLGSDGAIGLNSRTSLSKSVR